MIWFAGTPLFGIFGGLLGYAFGFTHTAVASWRLLYIVFGSVTTIFGIFFALFFPSSPDKASFLTEDERTYITMMVFYPRLKFKSNAKLTYNRVRMGITPLNRSGSGLRS